MGLQVRPAVLRLPVSTFVLWCLPALALLAYAPFLTLPFIGDDYVQIGLARQYGPVSGWPALAADALYRCRATSLIVTLWTDYLFGVNPIAFNVSSLLLHIINVWLVLALGCWRQIGWRVATITACCFAVLERPQEAVVWYAALPELLVFMFALLSILAWIQWLQGGPAIWYAGSFVSFVLALLSKESAVAVIGVNLLVLLMARSPRRLWLALVPHAVLSCVYAWAIFAAADSHLHLHDGTFSLTAPFAATMLRSAGRLLWPWGALAIAIRCTLRSPESVRLGSVAGAWILITLLPYSFVGYMARVPSRHVYMASVGLCLLLASVWVVIRDRIGPQRTVFASALGIAFVLHNVGYLWLSKLPPYQHRAAVLEKFIGFARTRPGTIAVSCIENGVVNAQFAAAVRLGRSLDSVIPASATVPDKSVVWTYSDCESR